MAGNISFVDVSIVIVYMAAVLALGVWLGRGGRTSADYFLGDRSLPWWALLLSIVATETSTVTFLSIPGLAAAAGGNLTFLQITIGYVVGRLFVVFFLLPLYFKGKPFTAYEVLETRFGAISRRLVSCLFLLTRNASDALRLFLTALVLQIVLGFDLTLSVIAIGIVTMAYTFIGGAKSVIWNDCIQFFVYMLGAAFAAKVLIDVAPGGLEGLYEYAQSNDKLQVFNFSVDLFEPGMTFWAGLIGGAFLTAATHGTDQMMVQRYLAARSQSDASLALGLSGFLVFIQFAMFLIIGVGLASLFADGGLIADGAAIKNDQKFAYFIVNYLPVGLLGLTLAAVFAAAMSTLSSSLNSSAAAFVNDIWLPLRDRSKDTNAGMRAGRVATLVFGVLQISIAIGFGLLTSNESIVSNVLKISGFAAGPVLGLYLLGVFMPRVAQTQALLGFVVGVGVLSLVAYLTPLYWAWYALTGALITVISGNVFYLLLPAPAAKSEA